MSTGETTTRPVKGIIWPVLLLGLMLLLSSGCRKTPPSLPAGDAAADRLKLLVAEDGLYRLTQEELAAAGLSVDPFDQTNLRLSEGETPIPTLIENDTLTFYGLAPTDRYTTQRAYVLAVGQPGEAMASTAVPALSSTAAAIENITRTLRLEENLIYSSEARTALNDDELRPSNLWFWQPLRQNNTATFDFDLPLVADGSGQIRVHAKGETYNLEVNPDHDFDVLVNDQRVGSVQFDGQGFYTGVVDIPAGGLKVGGNTLVLDNAVPGGATLDTVQLDWIEIDYAAPPTAVADLLTTHGQNGRLSLNGFSAAPTLFNIAQPAAPQLLTAATDGSITLDTAVHLLAAGPDGYATPEIQPLRASTWRQLETGADLLIVTTDALVPALQPLVAAREAEGLRVAVLPVDELYDEFGYGAASPESITAFVAYALENWPEPKPRYLFLVGDATFDYQNYLALSPANVVPAPMVAVAYSGETVSDSRLADVDGDGQPDLAVGRWPVDSVAAVESLVARTLQYEKGTAVNQAIFAADGTESQFTTLAQNLAQTAGLTEDQISLLTGPQATDLADRWQQGAWLATYVGHGSLTQWGKENVLTLDTAPSLKSAMPPFVLQLTCLTGLFTHPQQMSLVEVLLAQPQGPVLTVAATSLTLSAHQEPFANALLAGLMDPSVARIGDAFQSAKLSLDVVSDASLREISDTFALFGDPSAHIVRPNTLAQPGS